MATLHRIGDTLRVECTYLEDDGTTPRSLTDPAVDVQGVARGAGAFSATIVPQILDQAAHVGQFVLTADTTNWPAGDVTIGVIYSADDGALVTSTDVATLTFATEVSVGGPGDGAEEIDAIFGPINPPDELIGVIEAVFTGRSLLSRPLDPGDVRPIAWDFNDHENPAIPSDRTIDQLLYVGFGDAEAQLGMRIVTTGSARPKVDRDQKRIQITPFCDPAFQQARAYVTGIQARPRARFTLRDLSGNPTGEIMERSLPYQLEDL